MINGPRRTIGYGRRYNRAGTAVVALLVANGFAFLLQNMMPSFTSTFSLDPIEVRSQLKLYQLVSYMFLHGSFFHIFFNLFVLYLFGRELEGVWGTKRFLIYYFVSGIGAGVVTVLLSNNSVIGASGAIYGLLLAYGLLFPNRMLLIWFIIPMKAKYVVILFGVFEFLASMSGGGDGIAHLTHLGGMAFGGLLLAIWGLRGSKKQKRQSTYLDELAGGAFSPGNVDRILDKVLREGPESLTEDERETLLRAGKFYRKK